MPDLQRELVGLLTNVEELRKGSLWGKKMQLDIQDRDNTGKATLCIKEIHSALRIRTNTFSAHCTT